MDVLIFNGKFETENYSIFQEELQKLLLNTKTTFTGNVSIGKIDYTDYEEIKE